MQESDRKSRNQAKLAEMHPTFRARVVAVLQEMERAGYRPRIQEAWRSPEDQLKAYKSGASKLKYGFHNATGLEGIKEALAADILDDDRPDGVKLPYILHLAAAARRNGLITGAYFDLPADKIARLEKAIAAQDWNAPVHIGWDPLHVQVAGLTAEQVQKGKRVPDAPTVKPVTTTQPPAQEPVTPQAPGSIRKRYRITDLETNHSREFEWATTVKPVMLLPVPYVSQIGAGADAHRNDCGAASAVMLLRAYLGINLSPDEFYKRFAISGDAYLGVDQLRNAMGSLGLLTDFRAGLSLADLFNTLATGKPLIVLLRYKTLSTAGLTERRFEGPHFAVAVGMDCKYIYLHDPLYTKSTDGDAHAYPLDLFWQAWKEVGSNPDVPNPERSAIIPTAGIGFRTCRKAKITAQALFARSTPSVDGKVVATLRKDEVIVILREMGGWGEIGENRWISLSYTAQVPDQQV